MFDVFLAHNNDDKSAVRVVCNKLRRLGIDPWLDEEQIRAGEAWQATLQRAMTEVKSAAVFIGTNGLGKWQSMELPALVSLFVRHQIPLIPVLLPGVSSMPIELLFLEQFHAVTFENDIEDEKAIRNLYEGIIGRRSNQPPKVLKRGEILNNITDATLYLDQTSQDPVDEIRNHIKQGTLISPRYIYSFPYGANLWIALCNDPYEYEYYARSVKFIRDEKIRIIEAIKDINPEIIHSNPDYISLGCGNGVKDRILLEQILSQSGSNQLKSSYYYPYDISPVLLSRAIREVCESKLLKESIRIKAIEADFQNLLLFSPVYQYRQEPNIFSLLGNTLGNMRDDVGFLRQVRRAMYPDDVLLVEVRLYRKDDTVLSGDVQRIKQFDFTPLRWLGVKYESEKLSYSILENVSSARAVTLVANYQNFTIEEGDGSQKITKAELACVHLYQKNFQGEVSGLEGVFGNVGFKIEAKFVSESTAVFILTLDPQSDS